MLGNNMLYLNLLESSLVAFIATGIESVRSDQVLAWWLAIFPKNIDNWERYFHVWKSASSETLLGQSLGNSNSIPKKIWWGVNLLNIQDSFNIWIDIHVLILNILWANIWPWSPQGVFSRPCFSECPRSPNHESVRYTTGHWGVSP